MGGTAMALVDSSNSALHNPAALYFRESNTILSAGFGLRDSIDKKAIADKEPNLILGSPAYSFNAHFYSKNVELGLLLTNRLYKKSIGSDFGVYDAVNNTNINLTFAFGFDNIGIGIAFNGGNLSKRADLKIYSDNVILDYALQTLFERYRTQVGSEYLSISTGVVAKFNQFTFAFGIDELTSLNEEDKMAFSLATMLCTMNAGIGYSDTKFSIKNGTKFIVPTVSLELHDLLAFALKQAGHLPRYANDFLGERKTTINLGLELLIQLTDKTNGAVRLGFESGEVGYSVFGPYTISAGLAFLRNEWNLQLSMLFPRQGDVTAYFSYSLSF